MVRQLHQQQPDLTVHTLGFRVAGDAERQLSCIAESTGGLYLDATNGKLLGTRLAAIFDPRGQRRACSPRGTAASGPA